MLKPNETELLDQNGQAALATIEAQVDQELKVNRGVAYVSITPEWDFRLWTLLAKRYEAEGWGTKWTKPNPGDRFKYALVIHHKDVDPGLNPHPVDPLVLRYDPSAQSAPSV